VNKLKWSLDKQDVSIWTGPNQHKTGHNGRLWYQWGWTFGFCYEKASYTS